MLRLECLGAKHGDCLVLHHDGDMVLFDGGPAGVYKEFLEKWIDAKKDELGVAAVPFKLGMVTHIDDDHINGLLALTNDMVKKLDAGKPQEVEFDAFWFNSFSGLTGMGAHSASVAAITAAAGDPIAFGGDDFKDVRTEAIVASVPQGHKLSNNLGKLGLGGNSPFNGLISGHREVEVGGMTFHVVGPLQAQLDALQEAWAEVIPPDELAAFVDKSVPNLSSIVVMVEADGKKLLMTGDARGDHILEALDAAGYDTDGSMLLDVFKVAHHGSDRNSARELFDKLPAKVYVISADGKHGNPDLQTIQWIAESRGMEPFEFVFASKKDHESPQDQEELVDLLTSLQANGNFTFRFRDDGDLSISIDL